MRDSVSDYIVKQNPTLGETSIRSGVDIDVIAWDVEKIVFEQFAQNRVEVRELYTELARFSAAAYALSSNDIFPDVVRASLLRQWHPVLAQELGLRPIGAVKERDPYSMFEGVYRADNASASVFSGVANGKNTLVVAFEGTNFPGSWTEFFDDLKDDILALKSHYGLLEPLTEGLKDYVQTGGVEQVWITGHSLGGILAQMFLDDLGKPSGIEVVAGTFGSPGARTGEDSRILHFAHTEDTVALLEGSISRLRFAGGLVRVVSDASEGDANPIARLVEHDIEKYADSLHKLYLHSQSPLLGFLHGKDTPAPGTFQNFAVGDDLVKGDGDYIAGNLTGHRYGLGAETLFGGDKSDRIFCRVGNDEAYGYEKSDVIDGGKGDDTLVGAAGRDELFGGEGGDVLSRDDSLFGGGDKDTLIGGIGADKLFGGGDDDTLEGGDGGDELTGGGGRNRFVLTTVSDEGRDTITDFSGGDKIDLSQIDADEIERGDQAFRLDRGGPLQAGEIKQEISGRDVLLKLNVDDDRAVEVSILVGDHGPLTAGDFVL